MKTNSNGRPCPEWCTADHAADLEISCRSEAPYIAAGKNSPTSFRATSVLSPRGDKPFVSASASPGGAIFHRADEARDTASLVESLADSTPARIRLFAAQIRTAADLAFGPEQEIEPEA